MSSGWKTRKKMGARLIPGFVLFICLLLMLPVSVMGQSTNTVNLSVPDLTQFPQITALFWPYDASGNFIQNVKGSDVRILENDRSVPIASLEMIEPGVHFVVAVNEGPTLANRYAGVERFASIRQDLSDWISAQPSTTVNDFSIVNNTGTVASSLTKPSDWAQSLENYQPDLRAASPSMTSLTSGIDAAGSVENTSNKTKALLYITPMPEDAQLSGIQDAARRAGELGVHLFIWLIGPQNYSATEGAMVLQKAASDTGGNFFVFSGAETLPAVASYLDPLKYVYRLTYITSVRSSGNFTLALEVTQGGSTFSSRKVPFSLKVAAPNPIFLAPPTAVSRTWVTQEGSKEPVLTPADTEIKVMFEYPDGHPRSLKYSRLFVDGNMVAENTSPPYDVFTWDISGFTSNGTHMLQVTIEDQLGLTSQTIEIPVAIQVEPKPLTRIQKVLDWFTPVRIVLLGLLAAALAVVVLILIRKGKASSSGRKKARRKWNDPLTQPVEVKQEVLAPSPVKSEPGDWPRGQGLSAAPARLRFCSLDSFQPLQGEGFAVYQKETTIGSDPKKAQIVLEDKSISSVHAVIINEDGLFRLQDAGSTSGTWLNFSPVPAAASSKAGESFASGPLGAGLPLEHGDLIHFGRVPLIFEIHKAASRQIEVLPYGEQE